MEGGSVGVGFMAVIAVSGSVVFIAHEVHKRLLSDFMKKIEIELGGSGKCQVKRRVRFADDVMEPSSNNKEYRKKIHGLGLTNQTKVIGDHDYDYDDDDPVHVHVHDEMSSDSNSMPLNRQVLYKGIIKYKTLTKTHHVSNLP